MNKEKKRRKTGARNKKERKTLCKREENRDKTENNLKKQKL